VNIIGFVGSPRVGGNTETLVAEILRGAASAGATVEQVALNKLDISPCQGCDACRQKGRCRIQDDMQPLYDKLFAADAIVLGTPIYCWGPSAQTKAFLDRLYGIDVPGSRENLAGKPLLLTCAFADKDPAVADNTVNMLRTMCEWFEMPFPAPVLASADKRGEVAQQAETMRRAYGAGAALAQLQG
jgi:multimeric flavodoxin WrbA